MYNTNVEMRVALISEIEKIMEKDDRIVFVDADLGKAGSTMKLREKFPERALDVGVAEQNMASVAAGLSSYGFIPFISSFTSFASRRIADQIAISISYAGSNVKIIGLDPGISAELNGGTHMSFEDVGIIRSIPGTVIFEPVDVIQLVKALPQIVDYKGMIYIRLFRKTTPKVFNNNYKFNLFKADVLKEGNDVSIFATGITVSESIKAVEILKKKGIDTELINVHTLKPIDKETIISSIKKTKAVVTCENHNIIGGLRSAIAEVMTEEYLCAPFKYIGVHDCFGEVGIYDYLIKKYKLSADDIVEKTLEAVSAK
jgi:transketolase